MICHFGKDACKEISAARVKVNRIFLPSEGCEGINWGLGHVRRHGRYKLTATLWDHNLAL